MLIRIDKDLDKDIDRNCSSLCCKVGSCLPSHRIIKWGLTRATGCKVNAQWLVCGGVQKMLTFPFEAPCCSRAHGFLPAADTFSFVHIYLSRPSVCNFSGLSLVSMSCSTSNLFCSYSCRAWLDLPKSSAGNNSWWRQSPQIGGLTLFSSRGARPPNGCWSCLGISVSPSAVEMQTKEQRVVTG